jgi:hypothetical protein
MFVIWILWSLTGRYLTYVSKKQDFFKMANYSYEVWHKKDIKSMLSHESIDRLKKEAKLFLRISDKQFTKWLNKWKAKFSIEWKPIPDPIINCRCAPDGKVVGLSETKTSDQIIEEYNQSLPRQIIIVDAKKETSE